MNNIPGEITTIAFGGEGVMRHDNLVIFVPFTAPQDSVVCQLTERKKNYAKGKVVEYEILSPLRIAPECPYFGTCGGCQLQHIRYESHLEFKRIWIEDALRKIGRLSDFTVLPVAPSPKQWEYRRHVTLNFRQKEGKSEAGFFAIDNQTLVITKECPIFVSRSDPIIRQVQEIVQQIPYIEGNEGRITLMKNQGGKFLLYFQLKTIPNPLKSLLQHLLEQSPNLDGIQVIGRNGHFILGNIISYYELDGLRFGYSPAAFLQNNEEQSLKIYRNIAALAEKKRTILDLYCGIGITSLMLSLKAQKVVSVEGNPHAINLAKENARLNKIDNVTFIAGDVKNHFLKWARKMNPDLVLLNPPRAGLDRKVIEDLLKVLPAEILYLSCMPSTLARDLNLLCDKYKLDLCQPFDMFPQTGHVETLAHLKIK